MVAPPSPISSPPSDGFVDHDAADSKKLRKQRSSVAERARRLAYESEMRGETAKPLNREGLTTTKRTIGLGSTPSMMTAKDAMAAARRNGHVKKKTSSTSGSSSAAAAAAIVAKSDDDDNKGSLPPPPKPSPRLSEKRQLSAGSRGDSVRFQAIMTLKDAKALAEEKGLRSSMRKLTTATNTELITDRRGSTGGIPSMMTKAKRAMSVRHSLAPHCALEGISPKRGGFGPGMTPSFTMPGVRKSSFVEQPAQQ